MGDQPRSQERAQEAWPIQLKDLVDSCSPLKVRIIFAYKKKNEKTAKVFVAIFCKSIPMFYEYGRNKIDTQQERMPSNFYQHTPRFLDKFCNPSVICS